MNLRVTLVMSKISEWLNSQVSKESLKYVNHMASATIIEEACASNCCLKLTDVCTKLKINYKNLVNIVYVYLMMRTVCNVQSSPKAFSGRLNLGLTLSPDVTPS